jgi:hypothetical protein
MTGSHLTAVENLDAEEWSDMARVVALSVVISVLRREIAGTAASYELETALSYAEALGRDLVADSRSRLDPDELPDRDDRERWPEEEYEHQDDVS